MEEVTAVSTGPDLPTSFEEVVQLERQYLLQNYGRYPLGLARGKGCYLYDFSGRRYLDLLTGIGVNALGHAHPRLTRVIREQAATLIHTSNLYYHPYQAPLAKKLAETSGLQRSFFCNSGTEAMEGALKMVKAHGRKIDASKFRIVALDNSFHGRSMGALSATGQPKYRHDFEPLLPGVQFVDRNDEAALEAAVNSSTAGIVLEGIQGEGGVYPCSPAFIAKARELADRYDALLIFDEIQCGVGRTGTYFSYQTLRPAVMPDIVTVAKPLACGLPMGAVICNDRAAASIAPGMHGSTFGGGALVCRVALEFFDILEGLLPRITEVGDYFRSELRRLAGRYSFIKEVRGAGLIIGCELDFPCKEMVAAGFEHGLLFNCTHDTVLRFLPPFILTEREVDKAITGLNRIFRKARRSA